MIPRTLDALRSAVARVLTARGEAPGALRVEVQRASRGYPRGRRWYATVRRPDDAGGVPPSWAEDTWAVDEASAISEAWYRFTHSLYVAGADARDAQRAADARWSKSLAALTAARAVEAGE